jgi:large subunit ribosomal protein L23
MSILKRPIVTEKTASLMDKEVPQYGFEVAVGASKDEIKKEVERVYEVEVENVNTMVVRGKSRQRFSKRGVVYGKTPNYKKAIVTLKEGFEIDFYKHI